MLPQLCSCQVKISRLKEAQIGQRGGPLAWIVMTTFHGNHSAKFHLDISSFLESSMTTLIVPPTRDTSDLAAEAS